MYKIKEEFLEEYKDFKIEITKNHLIKTAEDGLLLFEWKIADGTIGEVLPLDTPTAIQDLIDSGIVEEV